LSSECARNGMLLDAHGITILTMEVIMLMFCLVCIESGLQ